MPPLLKAAEEEGAKIFPLILSPCRFDRHEQLSEFQAVNDPSRPLIDLSEGEREKIQVHLVNEIEDCL